MSKSERDAKYARFARMHRRDCPARAMAAITGGYYLTITGDYRVCPICLEIDRAEAANECPNFPK